jgi:hypothetical protein
MKDKVGKVIDNWRHKDYLRDNIGHLLAVNLTIVWCNITCHNISSFDGLGDNNPPWWLLRIVTGGWTNAGACCKELLDHINVLAMGQSNTYESCRNGRQQFSRRGTHHMRAAGRME